MDYKTLGQYWARILLVCKQIRGVDNRIDWVINPINIDVNTYKRFQEASIKSYKLN
jgi:hypothetical protein